MFFSIPLDIDLDTSSLASFVCGVIESACMKFSLFSQTGVTLSLARDSLTEGVDRACRRCISLRFRFERIDLPVCSCVRACMDVCFQRTVLVAIKREMRVRGNVRWGCSRDLSVSGISHSFIVDRLRKSVGRRILLNETCQHS